MDTRGLRLPDLDAGDPLVPDTRGLLVPDTGVGPVVEVGRGEEPNTHQPQGEKEGQTGQSSGN